MFVIDQTHSLTLMTVSLCAYRTNKKRPPDVGLSAVIGIIVAVLLVTIAAAVISHHCIVFDQGRQMRK